MSLKSAGGRPRRAARRARKSLRGASGGGASRGNLEKSERRQDGQRLGDADLSRASLMTSGIFGLAFTMSAEPEPEHPVRQQRMRPVAALLINRSSASPVPPSIPPPRCSPYTPSYAPARPDENCDNRRGVLPVSSKVEYIRLGPARISGYPIPTLKFRLSIYCTSSRTHFCVCLPV